MDQNVRYFLLRRLHSLLGIFPLGIFLFGHLVTNGQAIMGAEAFEHKVALIHSLGPALPIVEAVMIFIPLALHIALGIVIALTGKSNAGTLKYGRNIAYTLQRLSGWAALAFILYHVVTLRFLHDMDAVPFSAHLAQLFKNPLWVAVYFLGSLSVVYHFANGICTFCMTWGLTVGRTSQLWMARAAVGVGAALMLLATSSLIGFIKMDPAEAQRIGEEIHGKHGAVQVETAAAATK
ncbi:MAG: succinate dehydrogenase [Candidatus Sumerlaeia bacterium]|nr:succinate dehydrogenase [Candidatus Sumerlaeia bacterium]